MTNEQIVIRIQEGETELIESLWEQVKLFAYRQAGKFYWGHVRLCAIMGVEIDDLNQESFIGLHNAVYAFKTDNGANFMTYLDYHFRNRFFSAIKLNRAEGRHFYSGKYTKESLDTPLTATESNFNLLSVTPDPNAEIQIDDIVENEYLSKAGEILDDFISQMPIAQKAAAIDCIGQGLTYAKYARQKGVTRASAKQASDRALKKLRNSPIVAYAN